ncbi:hypothetical protein AB0G04_28860 [Actinoplanes sp. NPDC023801]|uniref:hypothetical protein n=1 Tax=Actinoplanes sp. NPDC023801 TaxID=3154595 RepID=UPI0033F8700A
MVVLLIVLGMVLLVACAALWPDREEPARAEPPAPLDVATSLEGALASQLLAGEINPGQYQRALARLAARDSERHPLSLPPRD